MRRPCGEEIRMKKLFKKENKIIPIAIIIGLIIIVASKYLSSDSTIKLLEKCADYNYYKYYKYDNAYGFDGNTILEEMTLNYKLKKNSMYEQTFETCEGLLKKSEISFKAKYK